MPIFNFYIKNIIGNSKKFKKILKCCKNILQKTGWSCCIEKVSTYNGNKISEQIMMYTNHVREMKEMKKSSKLKLIWSRSTEGVSPLSFLGHQIKMFCQVLWRLNPTPCICMRCTVMSIGYNNSRSASSPVWDVCCNKDRSRSTYFILSLNRDPKWNRFQK